MRFISATYVFDGKRFLNDSPLLALDDNNCFVEYRKRNSVNIGKTEHYDGIICPGFINAHCHLELSYMLGVIPEKGGFLNFGKNIMTRRNSYSKEEIAEAISVYDKKMAEDGIVAIGDIANTSETFETKSASKNYYHTFIELISLNPEKAEMVFASGKALQAVASGKGLESSLVPHAPYSVSDVLMRKINEDAAQNKLPVSIHNQETPDEDLFFQRKEGPFVEFYEFLKIPIDHFQPSGTSSLKTYLPHLDGNSNLILVHNTFTPENEVKWANSFRKNIYWCLCPKANLYIENTIPELNKFTDNDCKIIIGTDSLASNNSLSVISELNVLLKHFHWAKIGDALKWGTYNGAEALGINDKFGGFIKGRNAGINHLTYRSDELVFESKIA
jgi:cytosine/adenosine deaminase-related metal-dependent hydrolase